MIFLIVCPIISCILIYVWTKDGAGYSLNETIVSIFMVLVIGCFIGGLVGCILCFGIGPFLPSHWVPSQQNLVAFTIEAKESYAAYGEVGVQSNRYYMVSIKEQNAIKPLKILDQFVERAVEENRSDGILITKKWELKNPDLRWIGLPAKFDHYVIKVPQGTINRNFIIKENF